MQAYCFFLPGEAGPQQESEVWAGRRYHKTHVARTWKPTHIVRHLGPKPVFYRCLFVLFLSREAGLPYHRDSASAAEAAGSLGLIDGPLYHFGPLDARQGSSGTNPSLILAASVPRRNIAGRSRGLVRTCLLRERPR